MATDDRNQRIDAILDAAERIFSRYGYRQTNMELLAREAGLSRQGLYLSFRSKSAVFAAVVERIQKESLDSALQAAGQARTRRTGPVQIVTALINSRANSFLSRLKDSPYVTELNEESGRICPEIVDEYKRKFVASVGKAIDVERKGGRLALPDGMSPDKAAQLIATFAHGLKLSNPPPSIAEFKRDLELVVSLFLKEL